MREIHVRPEGKDSTLLEEVDQLAGVSGGAFPAAHFGLYGAKSFETFPEEFLYPDIEAYVWGTFLLPWNWDWLVNPLVGTNDRMTEIYDQLMFRGATFADLARRGRPQVSINATDINFGRPFGFLPQTFDVICSDLASVPIARAVAASNGLPVLFSPVTLRNYRGPECPLPPAVPQYARERAQNDLRARALLEILQRYSDPEQVRWIHLMDGGISDNLALRVLLNDALLMDAQAEQLRPELLPGPPPPRDQRQCRSTAEPELAATTHRQRLRADHFRCHRRADQRLQPRDGDSTRAHGRQRRRQVARDTLSSRLQDNGLPVR